MSAEFRNGQNPPSVPREISWMAEQRKRIIANLGPSRRRHALLIGGSGYIGGPLTAHLLAGGYTVTNLDLLLYRNGGSSIAFMGHPDYRLVVGDMGHAETLDRAMTGVTDVIILAGLVGDPITRKFPLEAAAINDDALRSCVEHLNGRGLERVVFVSTCSNYGLVPGEDLVNEDSPLSPLSSYARSKVAAEAHILSLRGRVDYTPTVLRFATAFGLAPRMRFDLTVNQFARELYLGRELIVYDAQTWRPYCHVKDFARLIEHVLDFPANDVAFEIFNAGTERNNATKAQIVEIIRRHVAHADVEFSAESSDRRNYRVDFSKLRRVLGFDPMYSIEDGVREVLWALSSGLLDGADQIPHLHGNYSLPGLVDRSFSSPPETLDLAAGWR